MSSGINSRNTPSGHGSQPPGGYKIKSATLYSNGLKMKDSDIKALECPFCHLILREPCQLITCGCRFCTQCLDWFIANRDNAELNCPVDSTPFSSKNVRKDKGCVKEINLIQMDCPAHCDWKGLLIQSEEHLQLTCLRVTIFCPSGCGKSYPRLEQDKHLEVCLKRSVACSYCGISVTKDELDNHHETECQEYPVTCDYCHENLPSRREFPKHLEDICNHYQMTCPVRSLVQCDFKGKRVEVNDHLQQHMIVVFEKLSFLVNRVETLETENKELKDSVKEKDDIITKMDDRLRNLEITVRHPNQRKGYHEIPDVVEADGRIPSKIKSKGGAAIERSFGQHVVTDGGSNVAFSARQLASVAESSETNKIQIRQLSQSVQVLQEGMTQQAIAVDEIRLRQDILDVRTTNGSFIWKIPDIRRRYREAIDRRTVSIYSPPYFTSAQGYRMCTRVYLNGDGIGKGTHISVFFVLMKSEHDNLLQWPFKQSVRFTLINQVNQSASITEAFAPDLKSPSFQQPENEMNIASGFPKFAKQSVLQDENFTKGNTIYIKAQVDLSGLAVY